MPADRPKYVFDTSAILALRGNEVGADRVDALLRQAMGGGAEAFVSFMTRMELLHGVTAAEGPKAAADCLRLLDGMGLRWVSCEPAILERAATIKARGRLSVADAWIAATAVVYGATLVHADPEFENVSEAKRLALR